jgi:hypothetical protein
MSQIYLILTFAFLHAFHLSKTEINFDEPSMSLQVASKIYIDDLELHLGLDGYKYLKIGTQKEHRLSDSLILNYIQNHLIIKTDNPQKLNYNYLGKELSEDLLAIWLYIEIPLQEKPAQLEIKNSILTDYYDDQKNMVIVKRNNKMIEHTMLDVKKLILSAQL